MKQIKGQSRKKILDYFDLLLLKMEAEEGWGHVLPVLPLDLPLVQNKQCTFLHDLCFGNFSAVDALETFCVI